MWKCLGSVAATFAMLGGCSALTNDMHVAEFHYEQARYEDSLVWLTNLEGSVADMERDMRARYYFLRGMSALRLGQRDDALYYLALARESTGDHGEGLRPEWREAMDRSLGELTPEARHFRARSRAEAAEETASR